MLNLKELKLIYFKQLNLKSGPSKQPRPWPMKQ